MIGGIIALGLIFSGAIGKIFEFFGWLAVLDMTKPSLALSSEFGIKIATYIITYIGVGILFNVLDFFDSDLMKIVYIILSTLISYLLTTVIYWIELYFWQIILVLVGVTAMAILARIILYYLWKIE